MKVAPRGVPLSEVPQKVSDFIGKYAAICNPSDVHVCDGSEEEVQTIYKEMMEAKVAKKLSKYTNCYLVDTDPADVARVESHTVISTKNRHDVVPNGKDPHPGAVPNWMSPDDLRKELEQRLANTMHGRRMYVLPYCMGPLGSDFSKIGVQLTDCPYVVASMKIMTRMGKKVLDVLGDNDFVKCVHSVGRPLPLDGTKELINNWPCDPEHCIISHLPEENTIISWGSGYGGNSLLGKKCLALRLGSYIAKTEGWLAEHMLILGIVDKKTGKKRYIAASFPSQCGKTNLAMIRPKLEGYDCECVGDDIAWLKFDKDGNLRAINPEFGFFGVAPGTNNETNPVAMQCIFKNTIFTNVAYTSDGGVFWEGLEKEMDLDNLQITDWKGNPWNKVDKAAHPNSRFCSPAAQCPIMDPKWQDPEGVVIDAILFGGRRPVGVPLIFESFNWEHGVLLGASMKSQATAAAEHKGKKIMHDPFAMRPFVGYNYGEYFKHWLSFQKNEKYKLPKIYYCNWFRKSEKTGEYLWPGFGDNIRVLDWVLQRTGEDYNEKPNAIETPIGLIPTKESFNLSGLEGTSLDWDELFSIDKNFWTNEMQEVRQFFEDNIGDDMPNELYRQMDEIEKKLSTYKG